MGTDQKRVTVTPWCKPVDTIEFCGSWLIEANMRLRQSCRGCEALIEEDTR
jgi:hypothetical protein